MVGATKMLGLFFTLALAFVPELAIAAADEVNMPYPLESCSYVSWYTGATGKALATIFALLLIIIACFRVIKWWVALLLILTTFMAFGAADIIAAVSEPANDPNCQVVSPNPTNDNKDGPW